MYILLFLLAFCSLFAAPQDPSVLAATEGEPSLNIADCVNAMTGDFIISETDHVVPGVEPIVLRRFYLSGNGHGENGGWEFFPHLRLLLYTKRSSRSRTIRHAYVSEPNGTTATYSYHYKNHKETYTINFEKHGRGITNTAHGVLSGRTNLKHNVLHAHDSNTYAMVSADGRERVYRFVTKLDPEYKLCLLDSEKLPNRNWIHYRYDSDHRVIRIWTTNPSQSKTYAWIEFDYHSKPSESHNYDIRTSDGKKFSYRFIKSGDDFYLTSASSSTGLGESDEYREAKKHLGPLVSKRVLPQNRYLKPSYYQPKHNHVGKTVVNIESSEDIPNGRVKTLEAPFGENGEQVITHRFFYKQKRHGWDTNYKYENGQTTIYDVYDNKTLVDFSSDFYPLFYQSFEGERMHHIVHTCFDDEGKLRMRSFQGSLGESIWKRTFEYDENGNVILEDFEGYQKRFAHNGGFLISRIEEDNGLITQFSYLHDTPLVTSKLQGTKDRILSRQFFRYNEDNILIGEMTDNGSSTYLGDWADVTVRRVKTYHLKQNHPALGFPEVIEEHYWDKGHPRLLKKTRFTYSDDAKVIKQEIYDADNVLRIVLNTAYNAMGQPIEESDAIGRIAKTEYDELGNKKVIYDPSGRKKTILDYDIANRLVAVKEEGFDHIVRTTQNRYDLKNNKISQTDHLGNTTHFAYDAFGHQTQIHSPQGEITYKTYDSAGRETSVTDPKGGKTTKTLNAYGHPTKIVYPNQAVEEHSYNPDGTLKQTKDCEGTTTFFTYDVFGRITNKKVVSSSGDRLLEDTFVYDGFNLLQKSDSTGAHTYYTYDAAGRKISETFQNGDKSERTLFGYDSLGRLSRTQNEDVVKITEYDLLDRIIEEREEDIHGTLYSKTAFAYDTAGNKAEIKRLTTSGESVEAAVFDSFNRPIQKVNAVGQITLISYNDHYQNAQGMSVLQTTTIDPKGIQTIETHDAAGRVVSIEKKNTLGIQISLEQLHYDKAGNLDKQISTVISPDGSQNVVVTAWEYGHEKRLSKMTEALGTHDEKTTQFFYNLKGLREQLVKPDGVQINYRYDPLGHLISITSSDASCRYRFEYNHLHLPTLAEDLNTGVTIKKTYDARGRLLTETLPTGALQSRYDTRGRRTELILPDQSTIHYHHGPAYLKTVERRNSSGQSLYSHHYTQYDPLGQVLSQDLIGNLGTVNFKVDALGRTVSHKSPYRNEVIEAFDPNGNVLRRTLDYYDQTYTYDDLNQLVSESFSHSPAAQIQVFPGRNSLQPKLPYENSYSFDSHYNRLRKNDDHYQINSLNQITSTSHTASLYDPNGNLLSHTSQDTLKTYTYDALDRLTSIEEKNIRLIFTYDAWHRRLSKTTFRRTDDSWAPEPTLYFLYDADNEIGAAGPAGDILQLRILGNTPNAEIASAIAIELGSQIYAPLYDLFGNLSTLISLDTRRITTAYFYTAYGEHTLCPLVNSPWRFSSKRTDDESGLVFFGRRYYQPDLGRWLTPDPDGFTDSLNLYAFVLNAPLTHYDLYGLARQQIAGLVDLPIYSDVYFASDPGMEQGLIKDSEYSKIIFTNGINNTVEEHRESLRYLSKLGRQAPIHGIYFPTHGAIIDIFRTIKTLITKNNSTIRKLHAFLLYSLEEVGPDGKIYVIAHSAGSPTAEYAIRKLPEDLQKRVTLLAIAPAKIVPDGLHFEAHNYGRSTDFVVNWQVMGTIKGLINGNLTFVPRAPGARYLGDHSLQSLSYQPQLANNIQKALKSKSGSVSF